MKVKSVIFVAVLIAGILLTGIGAPVSASWWGNSSKPTAQDWGNMALNVTGGWGWTNTTRSTLETMITQNRSYITDATTVNISTSSAGLITASSSNVSMAITAASSNVSMSIYASSLNVSKAIDAGSTNISVVSVNVSKSIDASSTNISTSSANAISAASANVSMAITASSTNISALRGNATTVMVNSTEVPFYNLTPVWSQITVTGAQSLNFTTPSAGTYLVTGTINENMTLSSATAGTFSQFALCDANNMNVVTNSERMGTMLSNVPTTTSIGRTYVWIYSNTTGASEVGICGRVSATPDGRWAVVSDSTGRSTISYVRLP